ncbi:hypothetical protein LJC60_10365 [Ruminococcaceae bacterium OttesenSCG-928-D13]|nr:hypothetical protein [Ruminococcaceae bacterium OttesenSCG-928-D13]
MIIPIPGNAVGRIVCHCYDSFEGRTESLFKSMEGKYFLLVTCEHCSEVTIAPLDNDSALKWLMIVRDLSDTGIEDDEDD